MSNSISASSIKITVKLFAIYQEVYGVPEITLQLPAETTVSQVLEMMIKEHPKLEKWRELTRFGINLEFNSPETRLKDGDEVALIPPVSGG